MDYECEKKPMKVGAFAPSDVNYVSELTKGRFSVTSNISHAGKMCTCKVFDKADAEGEEAAKREFKNLKTLRHEKMVRTNELHDHGIECCTLLLKRMIFFLHPTLVKLRVCFQSTFCFSTRNAHECSIGLLHVTTQLSQQPI